MNVINLHCGIDRLGCEIATALKDFGVRICSQSEMHLLVDAPLGWAFWKALELREQSKVVVSDNPCPEYRLDLLELEPVTLLRDVSMTDIVTVLQRTKRLAAKPPPTPLSSTERLTLRLIAIDHSNDDIARFRHVETQTVKNTVRSIYQKLYLKTRVQVAHYYFGNWHLLKGWTPPPHIVLPENELMARGGA